MKIKKILKIVLALFIIFNLCMPIINVEAKPTLEQEINGDIANEEKIEILGVISLGQNFNINAFEGGKAPSDVNAIVDNSLGTMIGIVRIIGVTIAIVILLVIACKYMIASPGDRADIKKNAIPFVIGAFVLFGATGLLGIIIDFSKAI